MRVVNETGKRVLLTVIVNDEDAHVDRGSIFEKQSDYQFPGHTAY